MINLNNYPFNTEINDHDLAVSRYYLSHEDAPEEEPNLTEEDVRYMIGLPA